MSEHLARTDQETTDERIEWDTLPPQDGDRKRVRLVVALVAAVAALVSFFFVGRLVSDPAFYRNTVAALDEKKQTVMNLMAASTGSSAAISLLPGDAGTPIAEKLVDLSSDFLAVLAAIYLEKYLLTIMGFTAFKVLVPIGCLLVSAYCLVREGRPTREVLMRLGVKLLLFGVSAFLVVPVSVRVSGMIEQTYEASITQTIQTAEQTTDAIEESADDGTSTDAANPLSFLLSMPEELNKLTDAARNSLNNFIEALAVMIVTSCIIPILVLLFFVWLARTLLGIDIKLPAVPTRRALRRRRQLP